MDQRLTIVLLGNTGVGKSASGNTILGETAFKSQRAFKAVTKDCSQKAGNVFGRQISVIDTPGILCPGAEEQVKTCCQDVLRSSRPRLFLVVIKIDRFTDEQQRAVEAAVRVLGHQGLNKSYMLFTCGDALDDMSLEEFINNDDESSLPEFVVNFNGRYHVFNNEDGGAEQVKELLTKSGHLKTQPEAAFSSNSGPRDLRIVLLGLSGCGKSSSGNTILGSRKFKSDCAFDAVSRECVSKTATLEDRWVTVVDTPGFTEDLLTEQKHTDIMRSIVLANPGPHAFIFVVKLGRIYGDDAQLIDMLPDLFGNDASKYTMVLFTHGDELRGKSIERKIRENSHVSELVSKCDGRYCVFDNTKRSRRQQVTNLLKILDKMVTANREQHYTSEMFETFINEAQKTGQSRKDARRSAWKRFWPFVRRQWRKLRDRLRKSFRQRRNRTSNERASDEIPLMDQE